MSMEGLPFSEEKMTGMGREGGLGKGLRGEKGGQTAVVDGASRSSKLGVGAEGSG